MEIQDINMISDFCEVGMKSLQNPSFISRFFSVPGVGNVHPVYRFLKWGALISAIFAIFATFSSIKRLKLFFIHLHTVKPSTDQKQDYTEFSEEDDDVSLASSDDEGEDGRGNSPSTSFRGQNRVDGYFRVKGFRLSFKNKWQNGSFRQRSRRNGGAWPEFASGINVVKLWNSLGLSLDFDDDLINYDSEDIVSLWDYDQDRKRSDSSGGDWDIPATAVWEAAANEKGDGVILGGYDSRVRSRVPALYAEWSSPVEEVAGVTTGGVGNVYVRDDMNRVVTFGDVRKMSTPLENVRESDGDTWWDADAVIVDET